jgi:hypothetical protein
MPRIKRGLDEPPPARFSELVAALVDELKSSREAGQPMIEEQYFPRTSAIRATVIWDRWAPLADEERSASILQAYRDAEGKDFSDRIALAIGLTVPEAHESGLLPYQVTAGVRQGDPVTPEQCARAMTDQGASLLVDPKRPQLRFATEEEAEACVRRLAQALPRSEPIWVISRDDNRVEL